MTRCAVLSLLICVGCTSELERPPTYPITGTVTWNGTPVEGARVVFVPSTTGLEPAAGAEPTAPEMGVKVSKYDVNPPTKEEMEKYKDMTFEQEQATYAEDELPTPPAKNLLPEKYQSETTSGILHKVTNGPTTLDIVIVE